MLKRVMIAVIEPAAPGPAERFPILAQGFVIIRLLKKLAVAEQIEVHGQSLLVQAARSAIPFLFANLAVQARVTVRIAKGQLIAVLIGIFDQQANHFGKAPLLASE